MKVSVITVTYNCKETLQECIDSVNELKKNGELQYIIIDGVSTDGTLDIINKNRDKIDCFISEKDKGIYDAMNKGINKVEGDYFIFLGADDRLVDIPFEKLQECKEQGYKLVAGNVKLDATIFYSKLYWRMHIANTLHHQGLFYSKELNIHFDTNYRVFADFDLNQKFYKSNTKIKIVDNIIAQHSENGISHSNKYEKEYLSIIMKNYGLLWMISGYIYLRYINLKK